MTFDTDQRIHIPGKELPDWVTVRVSLPRDDGGCDVFVALDDDRSIVEVALTAAEASEVQVLEPDAGADSARVLAGMWTRWMAAASINARTTLLASSPLRPYAHQANAVYGAMLPQPRLRFLLADEPGTGKTIMAGLYLREMQRLNLLRKALVVAPANLVSKWQEDFGRFLGGGLRRITASTVHEHALDVDHDLWIVSLELAAINGAVQEAIRPDRAGWDIVVFDEAHRLTPTAQTFHRVGRLVARGTPSALLMTATPHRGKEWFFRHLLHLVDPDIYPDPGDDPGVEQELSALRPGSIHFLRRMKEDLVDYDGVTPLFKGRHATNHRVPLGLDEYAIYQRALELVELYFQPGAKPLARMVYGKRAASSLFALRETLRRREEHMGEMSDAEAVARADPYDEDEASRDEARVINADSVSARAERKAIGELVQTIDDALTTGAYVASKWHVLIDDCLAAFGIVPGSGEHAVLFTEYADTADWLTKALNREGFDSRMYSGRLSHQVRDEVRAAFMRGEFQIIVSTDAGNEGIDLQAAHILVNYDIPWSLVRLEQRMGRIHRVGQHQEVELFNLIATDTREGDTLHTLLENFVTAANELGGQMFDSLSLVAELTGVHYEEWLTALYGDDDAKKADATAAARRINAHELRRTAERTRESEADLASKVDALAALTLLQQDVLERINPAIVEAYLARLNDAGLLSVRPTAAGEGFLELQTAESLPAGLGGKRSALVATSGDALREGAVDVDASRALALGPGEPAFTDLVALAARAFEPDLYRGGAAEDPTSITGYDLYVFEGLLSESEGRRSTTWATLIRVDDNGHVRAVRWEALGNLTPSRITAPARHPARLQLAKEESGELAGGIERNQRKARADWFSKARSDLQNLPVELTKGIRDREQRLEMRQELAAKSVERLARLESLSQVNVSPPTLTAYIRVHPSAPPQTAEEKDSEDIAMRHVARLMSAKGWKISDIHTENRGYDLLALRGREQRLLEVKGVWRSASATGVSMTGNEILIATQHRGEYWLYVVDHCEDGLGTLFGEFRDPATAFSADMRAEAVFKVPGSSLVTARKRLTGVTE